MRPEPTRARTDGPPLPRPVRLGGQRLLILACAFVLLGMLTAVRAHAAPTVLSVVEAEEMTAPAGATALSDASASGGKALKFGVNGTATARFSLASTSNRVTLRARGAQCKGAPRVVVKVDGVRIQRSSVTSSRWTNHSTAIDLAKGNHTVTLTFANDYAGRSGCSRDLYVDKLDVFGRADRSKPSPAVLSAKAYDQQVALSWTEAMDNIGIARYEVWNDDGYVTTLPATARSYVAGVFNGTAYRFRVVAYDAANNYANSNTVTITPPQSFYADVELPGAPIEICQRGASQLCSEAARSAVATVRFHRTFASIERMCFTPRFVGDLVDPGEHVEFSLTPQSGFGFINGDEFPIAERTGCLAAGSHDADLNLFMDGEHVIDVGMWHGTARLSSVEVSLLGVQNR